jgi:hypothetical protein
MLQLTLSNTAIMLRVSLPNFGQLLALHQQR